MIKFYNLIKSDSIRKHCEEIGYEFSTLQCIDTVFKSSRISLEDKHKLYNEIMETMPEPDLPRSAKSKFNKTLYELLNEHIEIEKRIVEDFMKDADKSVYKIFPSSMTGITLKEVIKKCQDHPPFRYNSELVEIDNLNSEYDALYFFPNGELTYVLRDCDFFKTDFVKVLDKYRIPHLPVPFKHGDIVYDQYGKKPVVFNTIHDQIAHVYQCSFPDMYIEKNIKEYDEISFFTGELEPKFKFLKVLSDYLKKKIDISTLLNAYLIHMEENFKYSIQDKYINNIFCEEKACSEKEFEN